MSTIIRMNPWTRFVRVSLKTFVEFQYLDMRYYEDFLMKEYFNKLVSYNFQNLFHEWSISFKIRI